MARRTQRYNFSPLALDVRPPQDGPVDSSSDESQPAEPTAELTPGFVVINWIAVSGHFLAACLMTVYLISYGSIQIPYTETYLKWNRPPTNGTCKGGSRALNTSTNGSFCIDPTTGPINCNDDNPPVCAGLDLGLLVIGFHVLSFLFQGAAGLSDSYDFGIYKYTDNITEGKNPLRFIEYSISASIMLMCISLLNGVTDINLIAAIAVLTASCQLCGLAVEYIDSINLQWLLHLTGWLQFMCAYGIILHAFLKAANADERIQPPDFVYAIVVALALLYSSFGLVQFTELCCKTQGFKEICCCSEEDPPDDRCTMCCKPGRCKSWCPAARKEKKCNPIYKEMVYVTLSLGAKLVLGIMIFSNVIIVTRQ
jgi:hypothetical protein